MMQFSQLQDITGGSNVILSTDRPVTQLITDSRKAIPQDGSVFFAINGEHHDGHQYIQTLYNAGVRQFVVEKDFPVSKYADANFLKVKSAVQALQKIAAYHRSQFSLPVIAITGSNGKTIIKEWLYQLLSKEYTIVKNPGSYNSQIGVPLSVWQIQTHHTLGIFEAGISKPGEMEKLEGIIKPGIGIFTNIGTAHDENFSDVENKIHEKLKLFQHAEQLICCADHLTLNKILKQSGIPLLTWGFSEQADIRISKGLNNYVVTWNGKTLKVEFPFSDQASIENAFHCIALMLQLGIKGSAIQERIHALRSVPMRLELKEGINQSQVIDDTYNNDLAGLQISLDFLNHQSQKTSKTLILSDILQSGLEEGELTDRIAQLVNNSGLKRFIGIGPALSKHAKKIRVPAEFFLSADEFLKSQSSNSFQQEVILVKGARIFQFEKIVSHLQRRVHGTIMEVNLSALVYNLNFFKSKLKAETKVMVMVKAFAYGSGSVEVANVLQYNKIDYLGVAYADEGVDLRRNNITLPIMVMNPSEDGFHSMLNFNLEPEIYGFKILNEFTSFLQGRRWKIHVKIDTGMHRLGFEEGDIGKLVKVLSENKNLEIASIFTHLAGSDEVEHDDFSKRQAENFLKSAGKITEVVGYKPILHALNTPGMLRFPEYQFGMVRLGIGLYGVDPTNNNHNVRPVTTLKTIISQIREVKAGESVGYSRKGKAIKTMKVATIAVGYADGYSRAFSGGVGEVIVNGKRAKVVGNVCMDMTMIDITDIDAKEGDEVILFGEELPIGELANKINTIPYEILTNTSERVKRVFVAESI
ncbi:MAG TPA: bifunctional UDP-N-acetylmuramoyl-tripeptide:D-alanyl-D-alanine ligase/alanine racemase [Cyclobacteriaceae bacterium]|nr:bifunctional UDP-N-acetylmuramoyl-tripeptide:D-alanyl-D-alanine ligase/alanine racemase [Cyclobacteriaceae bacterium]